LGIKWPNDVLARPCGGDTLRTDEHGLYESGWRKIAGILIEQHNDRAIVGIGVNVGPSDWPEDLTARAVSLKQLNCPATRIDVMSTVLPALDEALAIDDATLRSVFRSYDLLTGCSTRVRSRGRSCCGSVLSIDPLRGLELQPHDGGEPFWCPAESTTLSD
jgi:biotin-(acetyl-CoA carboxylase) ligase